MRYQCQTYRTAFPKSVSTKSPGINTRNHLPSVTSKLQRALGNQALATLQRQPLPTFRREHIDLQKDAQGAQIALLQQKLNTAQLSPLRLLIVDGKFGEQTELHVREFQRRNQLPVTGIVDRTTWAAIEAIGQVIKPQPAQQQSATSEPPWLAIARNELGVKEIVGKQHNPRVLEYLGATRGKWSTDETPWCSGFVNWVMAHAGMGNTGSAAALSWRNWGKRVNEPAPGAIGVIDHGGGKGHVGFVIGRQGNNLLLLGGNQRNAVSISVYPVSKFCAFVFPSDYEVSTITGLQEVKGSFGKTLNVKETR